jgi:hypothetical protein
MLFKDNMFVDICKAQIIVFPEGTAFTNAYTSVSLFLAYVPPVVCTHTIGPVGIK